MKRASGRNIYITNLKKVVGSAGAASFATRCEDSKFSAIWVRVGRGPQLDKNFSFSELAELRHALNKARIELWGWHVPFCENSTDARDEANLVVNWAENYSLAGILLDAEKTDESPRFRGGRPEARIYAEIIHARLTAQGRGIALSSHDQPSLHKDLPFDIFLENVNDNCPQVYYHTQNVAVRLQKSIDSYRRFEADRDFNNRYKPTGNITTKGDVAFRSVNVCLDATKEFIRLVRANEFGGYSFWCWDDAPKEIWKLLQDTPV
jgi:hypothetical protein